MARRYSEADPLSGGTVHVPRSRGALSGVLLVVLGAWGALIPFIGPAVSFGFTPNDAWHWTSGRGWLELLPGAVTAFGGLLLLLSANRITALFGSWLAVAGGAWFVVGNVLAPVLHLGQPGTPAGSGKWLRAIESLAYFDGLGALILFLGAASMGRLSVRSVRDVKAAQRRRVEDQEEEEREVDHRRMVDERRQAEERREAEDRRQAEEDRLTEERRQAEPRRSGDIDQPAPTGAQGASVQQQPTQQEQAGQPYRGPGATQAPG